MATMSQIYAQQIGQRPVQQGTNFWGALSSGIHDFGHAYLAKKAREREQTKAQADQQARTEIAGMDISNREGINQYIDAVRTKLADPNIQPETRKYWESQLTSAQQRAHDYNLADYKQIGAERIQILKNMKENDGNKTVDRMKYDLAQSPIGKTGSKAYFTSGGARILDDVANMRKLAEAAYKQNVFTKPGWLSDLFGTYNLSQETKDFNSSSQALGAKITENIRQIQEQLGLSQKGVFSDADAARLARVIADANPFNEDGSKRDAISWDEFDRRMKNIEDKWTSDLGNALLQWKEDPKTGKTKLWAFGQDTDEAFDVTSIRKDPRAIYIRLNQLAQDSTYEGTFSPEESRYIINAIKSKLEGPDRLGSVYDQYEYELPEGWSIK